MNFKFLTTLLLGLFLINFATATVSYAEWSDFSQKINITEGESVSFEVSVFTMNPDITLNIKLYDVSYNLLKIFESTTVNNYSNTLTITPSMYNGVGSYEVIVLATDASGNSDSHSIYLTVKPSFVDNTAPIITLLGNNPVEVVITNSYIDAGATAQDDTDGNLTSSIIINSNVDTNIIGTYQITYNVQDSFGNNAVEVVRTVNVVETIPIDENPVITIIGDNPLVILLGGNYTEFNATANDTEDGDLTNYIIINSSFVNTNIVGVYNVSYTVQDSFGNIVFIFRTVNVVESIDTQAPVISIIFPKDKTYTSKDRFFKVSVNEDSIVKFSIDGNPKITMDKIGDFVFEKYESVTYGIHEVIFYATDVAGNVGTATREFRVKKKSTPKKDDSIIFNPYEYLNQTNEEIRLPQSKEKGKLGWIIILFLGIGILIILLLIVLIRINNKEKVEGIYEEELSTDDYFKS